MNNTQTTPIDTMPVNLNAQVQNILLNWATAKGVDYNALVNDLLKKDIELIEVAR